MWGNILRFQKWVLGLLGLTVLGVVAEFAIEYARQKGVYDNPIGTVDEVVNTLTPIVNSWWFALVMGASGGMYVALWLAEKYRPRQAVTEQPAVPPPPAAGGPIAAQQKETEGYTLNDEQAHWLTTGFQAVALGSRDLTVFYEKAAPKSASYAREIANAIKLAGTWQAKAGSNTFDTPDALTGLRICVKNPDAPNKSALILTQKLRVAEIKHDWWAFPEMDPADVSLYVGWPKA